MNLREAAQMALEALMKSHTHPLLPDDCDAAITALRAALAEPEQIAAYGCHIDLEPGQLADTCVFDDGYINDCFYARRLQQEGKGKEACAEWRPIKLIKPTPHKPQTTHWEGCEAVHPECRKPEQEPVAWELRMGKTDRVLMEITNNPERAQNWRASLCEVVPLYYAPTPRKPLTDEEIDRVTDQQWAGNNHKPIYAAHRAYARAIERAHGIGDSNGS